MPVKSWKDKNFANESVEKIYEFLAVADAHINEIIRYTDLSRSHVLKMIHHLEKENRIHLKAYIKMIGKGGKPLAVYGIGPKPENFDPEVLDRSRKSVSAIRRLKENLELGPYAQLLN